MLGKLTCQWQLTGGHWEVRLATSPQLWEKTKRDYLGKFLGFGEAMPEYSTCKMIVTHTSCHLCTIYADVNVLSSELRQARIPWKKAPSQTRGKQSSGNNHVRIQILNIIHNLGNGTSGALPTKPNKRPRHKVRTPQVYSCNGRIWLEPTLTLI